MSSLSKNLGDRVISYTVEKGFVCTEIISVNCPKCKKLSDTVVTCLDRTYYGHWSSGKLEADWCIVLRHGGELKDYDLPDFLLYVQREQGSHENLNISSIPAHW